MKHHMVLLIACVVMAYHLQSATAQFSFSLPGKWGNGKRAMQGWAKRDASCADFDTQALLDIYRTIQAEAWRVSRCLQGKMEDTNKQ